MQQATARLFEQFPVVPMYPEGEIHQPVSALVPLVHESQVCP